MADERVFNFSAGPSVLPLPVLEKAAAEMTNCRGSGMSVTEMSHRSKVFEDILEETKSDFRRILNIPDTHEILFMQGGATFQFAAVPLNLIGRTGKADYALTGRFSTLAANEAKKYGKVCIAGTSRDGKFTDIPAQEALTLDADASYFYYCANNTIYGTEWNYIPDTGKIPLVTDMSSNLLSRPVNVSKFGLIYGGVQKNMAPAGMAVVIIRRDLVGSELSFTPTIMNYKTTLEKNSMYNTPPCFTIYMLGLTLRWIDENGGLRGMEQLRNERAGMIYDFLDGSRLFCGCADREARSMMNVTFRTGSEELDAKFVKEAAAEGLVNLKGHKAAGGMRASVYNAMPLEGAKKLVAFMKRFETENA